MVCLIWGNTSSRNLPMQPDHLTLCPSNYDRETHVCKTLSTNGVGMYLGMCTYIDIVWALFLEACIFLLSTCFFRPQKHRETTILRHFKDVPGESYITHVYQPKTHHCRRFILPSSSNLGILY